jgi:hypothetical protein
MFVVLGLLVPYIHSTRASLLLLLVASSFLKRVRSAATASSEAPGGATEAPLVASSDPAILERRVQEQALAALTADHARTVAALQSDRDRLTKDNAILRKAVTLQEERRVAAEHAAQQWQEETRERIEGLEQVIRTLRYHLQAAHATVGNDFMQPRPPDVY